MLTPISLWSETVGFPILTTLSIIPLIGLVIINRISSAGPVSRKGILATTINLLLSLYLVAVFDGEKTGIQFAENFSLLGVTYSVGVDGLSILFIPLTTLTTWLVMVFISASRHRENTPFILGLLAYEAVMIAAFSTLNLMHFWLVMLIEMAVVVYLITRAELDQKKRHLVVRIVQFFSSSLVLVLSGFFLLAFGLIDSEHALTFDLLTLKDNNAYLHDETLIFILLFYGFAIRMPLFPFHGWLPLLAEQGSYAGLTILIVGIKLGIYAAIRFIFPLVPGVAEQWSNFVILLCLVSIFYGALLAFMQTNVYRLLAFAILSHTGILVFGLYSFNQHGLEGTLLLSVVYSMAMTGKFISASLINEQTGTAMIPRMGDLFDRHGALGLLFLIAALSTMIMPGTFGFDAGHLLIEGVVEEHEWLIAGTILFGNVLAAGFLLWTFQRMFLADSKRFVQFKGEHKSALQEKIITFVICAFHIVAGLNSYYFLSLIDQEAVELVGQYPIHGSNQETESGTDAANQEEAPIFDDSQPEEATPSD